MCVYSLILFSVVDLLKDVEDLAAQCSKQHIK